jgi:2-keto-4-pentenoate hydratase/2-oxohepta-3-ene-1,7-dioic acid hydratase in catechol pathway
MLHRRGEARNIDVGVGVKIVLFDHAGAPATYGALTGDGNIASFESPLAGDSPQEQLEHLIDNFAAVRPRQDGAISASEVRLLPPVPWPGKIVCTTAVYASGAAAERQQLLATLKSPESVIGPSGTVRLPDVGTNWQFVPQAALGLVIRGPAKNVSAANWSTAVFGYTCAIDVFARGDQQFGRDYWLAKADTLGPLGPCIVTVDEIPDPSQFRVRSWQNGAPAQDFSIHDASHSIAEQVDGRVTLRGHHRYGAADSLGADAALPEHPVHRSAPRRHNGSISAAHGQRRRA